MSMAEMSTNQDWSRSGLKPILAGSGPEVKVSRNGPERRSGKRIIAGVERNF